MQIKGFFDWLKSLNEARSAYDYDPNNSPGEDVEQTGPYGHYGVKYVAITPNGKSVQTWTWSMGTDEDDAIESLVDFLMDEKGYRDVQVIDVKRVPARYATQNMPPKKLSNTAYLTGEKLDKMRSMPAMNKPRPNSMGDEL